MKAFHPLDLALPPSMSLCIFSCLQRSLFRNHTAKRLNAVLEAMRATLSVVPLVVTVLFLSLFNEHQNHPQREAAHPPDVSISKTALYSRIGPTEVEKPPGLLFQQPDLDSALQVARAEV